MPPWRGPVTVDPNPSSITLMTSINTRTKTGAHAGLLINGTERVLFDPAGSFEHPSTPERYDMLYGMTPTMLSFYADYQGIAPFQLIEQTIYVTPEVAEQVKQAAIKYGAANKAQCTIAIATVLRGVPGFEGLPMTWFPKAMTKAFATTARRSDPDHHLARRRPPRLYPRRACRPPAPRSRPSLWHQHAAGLTVALYPARQNPYACCIQTDGP